MTIADIDTTSTGARHDQAVVELRRYALHPGARDTLVALFDRAFVDSQEACGMSVLGQFRDVDRANSFVWLRGFAGMETRQRALAAFYDGPVWAAHRDAANATMISVDDVLLLKPAFPGSGFTLASERPPASAVEDEGGVIVATILHLNEAKATAFPDFFEETLRPALTSAGEKPLGTFVTEPAPNSYPRLPVREGETVFVWFSGFESAAAQAAHRAALLLSVAWKDALADAAARYLKAPPEVLRLAPTARSLLRG